MEQHYDEPNHHLVTFNEKHEELKLNQLGTLGSTQTVTLTHQFQTTIPQKTKQLKPKPKPKDKP